MPIDEITANPDENDPATIAAEIDLFVSQIKTAIPQINSVIAALNFNSTNSTSSTSLTVGTGTQNLTIETGKSWLPGMPVTIARTSAGTTYMRGVCVSYNSGTGALVASIDTTSGSGTYTDWSISFGVQVDPIRPGTEVLLATVNASAAAAVDIEDAFDTYDRYIIRADNITSGVAGSGTVYMRMKISGAYQTTTYSYQFQGSLITSQPQIALPAASIYGTDAKDRSQCEIVITKPSVTTSHKMLEIKWANLNDDALAHTSIGYATCGAALDALEGVRIYANGSPSITGTFRLYGVVS